MTPTDFYYHNLALTHVAGFYGGSLAPAGATPKQCLFEEISSKNQVTRAQLYMAGRDEDPSFGGICYRLAAATGSGDFLDDLEAKLADFSWQSSLHPKALAAFRIHMPRLIESAREAIAAALREAVA